MSTALNPTPDRGDDFSAEAGRAALRTFFNIAEQWHLSTAQQIQLLAVPRTTYYEWRKNPVRVPVLDRDKILRLSYVLGIYKALQILFPTTEHGARWIHAPNDAPIFNGRSALQRMLDGQLDDLQIVRRYLDAQRGGKA